MAKKFGKLLLFSAAIGSAVAAAYYFVQKKAGVHDVADEDDYDDFSEEAEEAKQEARNYVPLNPDEASKDTDEKSQEEAVSSEEEPEKENTFTPLTEQVAQASENAEEGVEEFFDEEDNSDEEPPISEV